jgi:hypothetical protein
MTMGVTVAKEKCRVCSAVYELGTDHTSVHCQREAERKRQLTGEKCPVCGGETFHKKDCPMWELFRERRLT